MNAPIFFILAASVMFVAVYSDCSEIYTSWMLRGGCNDTCGGYGVQKMIRNCVSNCSCSGPFVQWSLCNDTPCVFPRIPCGNGLIRVVVNGTVVCGYTAGDVTK